MKHNIWKINASIFPVNSMKKIKPMIATIDQELACEKQMNTKQNKSKHLKERD